MGNVARLAFDQELLEYRLDVLGVSLGDQEAGEVGAADHPLAGERARPGQAAGHAGFVQFRSDRLGALAAPGANGFQSGAQAFVPGIDAQADDMDGASGPGHRNLHPVDQHDAARGRGGVRFLESADVVVVGQREHLDALRGGVLHQFGGSVGSVGNRGMTVQVNLGHAGGTCTEKA